MSSGVMPPDRKKITGPVRYSELCFPGFSRRPDKFHLFAGLCRYPEIIQSKAADITGLDGCVLTDYAAEIPQGNIFKNGFMISAQRYRKTGIDLKITELNPAYSPQGDSVFAEKTDRITARNDVKIPERQIADVNISGTFSAEIGIRMRTQNRRTVSPECYAAEPAVPDRVIAGTTDADALTGAVQQTVGHGNIFTDGRNIFIPADRAENQTVISGSENTVADHNIPSLLIIC